MEWIIFTILAAFCWAITNTVDKFVLTRWTSNPIVPVMVMGVVGLGASIAVYLVRGFAPLSNHNMLWILASGIFYILMNFFYYQAAKAEEISRVIPLFYLTPLFIMIIAAAFLDEKLSLMKYCGIILLVGGAILISVQKIFRQSFGKAFWFMILSAFSLAINQVITKYLLGFTDFWTIFSWTRISTIVVLIPVYMIYFPDILAIIKEHGKKTIGVMALSETMNVSGIIFITIALSAGYVTLVNAVASIQPLFVLLFVIVLSIFYPRIIKEEIDRSTLLLKLLAIVLMGAGAVLVS